MKLFRSIGGPFLLLPTLDNDFSDLHPIIHETTIKLSGHRGDASGLC